MTFTVEETGQRRYVTLYKGDDYDAAERAFNRAAATTKTKVVWYGDVNTALDIIASHHHPSFTRAAEVQLLARWDH